MPESALYATVRPASTTVVDGWTIPATFGDAEAEYRALHDQAALVDLAFHTRIRVTGADRVSFLQGMLTNDLKRLTPAHGCAALMLTEQGKVVADMVALVFDDAIVLDGTVSAMAEAKRALERFLVADDVELSLPGDADHAFGLYGPRAAEALTRLGVANPPSEGYAHTLATVQDARARVVRVPQPAAGFLVLVAGDAALAWWTRCTQAGVHAAGQHALDVLRIENGIPWYERDFGADTIALEAPLDDAISFSKGCYLGQEVIERVSARGHVNRKLVGLEMDGGAVPADGDLLFAGEREVGRVTSAAWSWRLGRAVALGYVRREHLAPGTVLTLRGGAGAQAVTVRSLPFA